MSDVGYKAEVVGSSGIVWGAAGDGEAFPAGVEGQQKVRGLFTIGVAAVLAAIVFPGVGHLLDVFWVLSFCLTLAVLLISLSAREAGQVQSFPSLVVLVTALRIAVGTASAKLILLQGQAGSIVSFAGHLVIRDNEVVLHVVLGIVTVFVFGIIWRAVGRISRVSTEYSSDITTYKMLSINNNLDAGVISKAEAERFRSKTSHESGFFTAMSSAAGFMFCAAVLEVAIVIFNAIGAVVSGPSAGAYATVSIGAGMMMLAGSIVTILASKHLVGKSLASFSADAGLDGLDEGSIEIMSTKDQATGYQDKRMDCVEPSEHMETAVSFEEEDSSLEFRLARASLVTPAEVVCAEFTETSDNGANSEVNPGGVSSQDDERSDGGDGRTGYHREDYYGAILELIESEPVDDVRTTRTILMGAGHVAELAVTIPVNVGMRLARQGLRCLLLDVDLDRDAIGKVFDVKDTEQGQGNVEEPVRTFGIATCIRNLWVLPAKSFCDGQGNVDTMRLKDAIAAVQDRYDRIIIYAPNMSLLEDIARVGGCIDEAVLFGGVCLRSTSSGEGDIETVLAGCGCKVLKAPAVAAKAC